MSPCCNVIWKLPWQDDCFIFCFCIERNKPIIFQSLVTPNKFTLISVSLRLQFASINEVQNETFDCVSKPFSWRMSHVIGLMCFYSVMSLMEMTWRRVVVLWDYKVTGLKSRTEKHELWHSCNMKQIFGRISPVLLWYYTLKVTEKRKLPG